MPILQKQVRDMTECALWVKKGLDSFAGLDFLRDLITPNCLPSKIISAMQHVCEDASVLNESLRAEKEAQSFIRFVGGDEAFPITPIILRPVSMILFVESFLQSSTPLKQVSASNKKSQTQKSVVASIPDKIAEVVQFLESIIGALGITEEVPTAASTSAPDSDLALCVQHTQMLNLANFFKINKAMKPQEFFDTCTLDSLRKINSAKFGGAQYGSYDSEGFFQPKIVRVEHSMRGVDSWILMCEERQKKLAQFVRASQKQYTLLEVGFANHAGMQFLYTQLLKAPWSDKYPISKGDQVCLQAQIIEGTTAAYLVGLPIYLDVKLHLEDWAQTLSSKRGCALENKGVQQALYGFYEQKGLTLVSLLSTQCFEGIEFIAHDRYFGRPPIECASVDANQRERRRGMQRGPLTQGELEESAKKSSANQTSLRTVGAGSTPKVPRRKPSVVIIDTDYNSAETVPIAEKPKSVTNDNPVTSTSRVNSRYTAGAGNTPKLPRRKSEADSSSQKPPGILKTSKKRSESATRTPSRISFSSIAVDDEGESTTSQKHFSKDKLANLANMFNVDERAKSTERRAEIMLKLKQRKEQTSGAAHLLSIREESGPSETLSSGPFAYVLSDSQESDAPGSLKNLFLDDEN